MEISTNSSPAQALTPREPQSPTQIEATEQPLPATNVQPPQAQSQETASSTPPASVEPANEATDLNQLLLRNAGAQEDTQQAQENQPSSSAQQELQRNELEDRFNTLTNDAPAPNIDISA